MIKGETKNETLDKHEKVKRLTVLTLYSAQENCTTLVFFLLFKKNNIHNSM
jgi:hypothetical protein